MIARTRERQRGSAALETALALPVITALAVLAADLYTVARARADLERNAATLSSVLAGQRSLTAAGLDRLVASVWPDAGATDQIFVGQVRRSGRVAWGLTLGQAEGPCPNPLATGAQYQGTLPERDSRDDTDSVAMMVVQVCQPVQALRLSTLVLGADVLRTVSVDRMRTAGLKLDAGLTQRTGQSPPKSPSP